MRKGFFLLVILLFPSIIYLLFSLGQHHVSRLGFYGAYDLNAEGDTIYRAAPDLKLIDQDGNEFRLSDLKGKAIVLSPISYPCDAECKKRGATLGNYLNKLPQDDDWMILSLGMDADTPIEELKALKSLHLPDMDNWKFAKPLSQSESDQFLEYVYQSTGRVKAIQELPNMDFALLDYNGVIREFFDSRIYTENRKLEDAIKLIIKEPHISWKSK